MSIGAKAETCESSPAHGPVVNLPWINRACSFVEDPAQQNLVSASSAFGLTVVWATDNTREALWGAMARKDVYATTGTVSTRGLMAGSARSS